MSLSLSLLSLICFTATAAPPPSADCVTWYDTTQHGDWFRNVKDFGATGDGVTDDTAALLSALTMNRSAAFSTLHQAVVYVPPGTYIVSQTLPLWFCE